jgi:hypothetical protein
MEKIDWMGGLEELENRLIRGCIALGIESSDLTPKP